jgi:hypothetical protein
MASQHLTKTPQSTSYLRAVLHLMDAASDALHASGYVSQLACMLRRLLKLALRLLLTLMLDGGADDGHVTGMRTY